MGRTDYWPAGSPISLKAWGGCDVDIGMNAVHTLTRLTGRPAPFDFDADLRLVVGAAIRGERLARCITSDPRAEDRIAFIGPLLVV